MRNSTAHLRGYKELSTAGAQEKGWRQGDMEQERKVRKLEETRL